MRIDRFEMERTQCMYENEVRYNISESGVLPFKVREILEGAGDPAAFLDLGLKYPQSNGSELLRSRIAAWYEGATADHVLVTNGGSKANYTVFWGLLEKGDRAAIMIPNYLQAWGLGRIYGGASDPYRLVERREGGRMRWALDVDSLRSAVTRKTRLILVTNPNNPTGAVLTPEEMDEIVRAARRVNAWIVADEIYRGAELSGPLTPTFWGRYDKVLITSGLSKAFGLPGLRIGWITGPPKMVSKLWSYQDYTTLTPGALSDHLAAIVMEPARRERVLDRTRAIVRRNLPQLEKWIHTHDDIFSYIPPQAGAIATVGYDLPIRSAPLFDKLRRERSVLITPGAHFGIGKYIRIGYGYDIDKTLAALAQVDLTFDELQRQRPAPGSSARSRIPASRASAGPRAHARRRISPAGSSRRAATGAK